MRSLTASHSASLAPAVDPGRALFPNSCAAHSGQKTNAGKLRLLVLSYFVGRFTRSVKDSGASGATSPSAR
jgi:hypothetical protein